MLEEINLNTYRIKIPILNSPLKATNSYIIKGRGRNLIVDTGYNLPECREAMYKGLSELGISLSESDLFITHMHPDHLDMVWSLPVGSSRIYLSKPDVETVMLSWRWEEDRRRFASVSGFPEDVIQEVIERHSPQRFRSGPTPKFTIIKEGDEIRVGDYLFVCVETPGHSKGHMCLYEPDRKLLMAGDHILNDISPNIALWQYEWNPLEKYLESLDKISRFDVELVLPGHRESFRTFKDRVLELKNHHQARIEDILSILDDQGKDTFKIASEMMWDMSYESWDQFPSTQKLFATAEALSHLKYLDDKGLIKKRIQGQRILFTLK
ncbi:MAG: MBL fold metallo-hydrolase [Candidatus Bathyarchaeia archaeon]